MKAKTIKILTVSVFLCALYFFNLKESKKVHNVTLKNIEALASDEDDEDESEDACVGVGDVDCNGDFYKYIIPLD